MDKDKVPTWKWIQESQDSSPTSMYWLLCPHQSTFPKEKVLIQSKTFRKEKFKMLVVLESSQRRSSLKSVTDFCDDCTLFIRYLENG